MSFRLHAEHNLLCNIYIFIIIIIIIIINISSSIFCASG